MMEWGDHGLKMGEDVVRAMRETETTAHDMHEVMKAHGERFTGLLAGALDLVDEECTRLRTALLAQPAPSRDALVENAVSEALLARVRAAYHADCAQEARDDARRYLFDRDSARRERDRLREEVSALDERVRSLLADNTRMHNARVDAEARVRLLLGVIARTAMNGEAVGVYRHEGTQDEYLRVGDVKGKVLAEWKNGVLFVSVQKGEPFWRTREDFDANFERVP